ncbi:hypothetical protein ES703_28067 [subsurface metagenome]
MPRSIVDELSFPITKVKVELAFKGDVLRRDFDPGEVKLGKHDGKCTWLWRPTSDGSLPATLVAEILAIMRIFLV